MMSLIKLTFYYFDTCLWVSQNINTINKLNFKNIKIIEDFSHSQGAKIEDKFNGTIGLGGFSSMQGEKAISSEKEVSY